MSEPLLPPGEAADAAAPVRPVRQAALVFIFVTVFLDILALGIIVPVLTPPMVGGNAETAAWYIGVFGTAWAGMQFFAGPVLGALSDRFGRRPVILLPGTDGVPPGAIAPETPEHAPSGFTSEVS